MRFNIATAPKRDSRHWTQDTITWDELMLWMMDPADVKEAGNYILGTLTETTTRHADQDTPCTALHRNKTAIVSRDALMLDADTPADDFLTRVEALGVLSLVHTTFSSRPEEPRYRVIVPLSRPVSPAEYVQAASDVIAQVGADSFDAGSIQPERYMFRPAGEHFDFRVFTGPTMEPPSVPEGDAAPTTKRDPFDLPGVMGAFNRTYEDLDDLIQAYELPYEQDGPGRWRLAGTESAAGVSELDPGLWWSNHTTDPAFGHAQTAFDLMRLHLFHELDQSAPTGAPLTELPSYQAALEKAEADVKVREDQLEHDFGADSPLMLLGYDSDSVRDADMAMNLSDRALSDSFRYSVERGWYQWDGTRWKACDALELWEPISTQIREMAREWFSLGRTAKDITALKQCLESPRIRRIIEALRWVLKVPSDSFDAAPHLLNVANGTVDLRTGELLEHRREDYLTKVSPVAYRPGAAHADWTKALTAMRDDTVDWMQTRMGQAATGHLTTDDLLPILQGGGANGKTTFTGAISAALGEHAVFLSERAIFSGPNDHPTELMTLQGARFALLEETQEGKPLNIKRLKSLVGTPTITARRMRQDDETFAATHSLFLTTNYHVKITETDLGTWRRMALVVFPFTYSETAHGDNVLPPDPQLRTRIESGKDQLEAVLAWVVEGARRWYEAGESLPSMPESVKADTEAWRSSSDPLYSYVQDRLVFDPKSVVLSGELHEDFNDWMDRSGRMTWADNTFTQRFQGHESVSSHGVMKSRSRLKSRVEAGELTLSQKDPLSPLPSQKVSIWHGLAFAED